MSLPSSVSLNSPPTIRKTTVFGRLFEQFMVLELKRLLVYREKDWALHDWRTSHGAEVDIVLDTGDGVWAFGQRRTGPVHQPFVRT
jgi:predicted AAA+ superfamily ATPase